MARDLELNVKSKTSGDALRIAAAELDKTAREADKLGRAFDAAKHDAEQLDRELAKNAAAVRLLAKEYAAAEGDIRDGIKKRLDAERAAGAEMQRVRKDLIGDTERDSNAATAAFAAALKERSRLAAKAAQDDKSARERAAKEVQKLAFNTGSSGVGGLAGALGNELKAAFEKGAPEVKVAIANVVGASVLAAAAPIGAAINGVLLAGIGLAGIGLGIAGQLDNPAVQAAGKQLGSDLKKQLTAATSGFEKPIVAAAQILDTSLSGTLSGLKDDLDKLAAHLEPLARGIGALFENAFGGQGFADALEAAGPIIDDLAQNFGELGQNADRAFALLADGSDGAKDGLDLLFLAVETLIVGVAGLIDGFSQLYHAFLAPGREIMSWWDELRGNTDAAAMSLHNGAAAADEFGQSVEQGIGSVADFNNVLEHAAVTVDSKWAQAIDSVVGATLNLDKATLGWDESLTKLSDSIEQNGKTLDAHTKKGQANRDVILDGVQANLRLFDAEFKASENAEEAGKAFQRRNDALRAGAIAAGLNAGEVDKMIKKYGQIPPEIQTQIRMQGLESALNNLDETLRLINHLPPRKNVDINVNVHGNLFSAASAISRVLGSGLVSSGLGKRAAGGPVKAGETYVVGEHRPELFVPKVDGMILPSVPDTIGQQAPSAVAMWGGQSGGGSQPSGLVLHTRSGGEGAIATMVTSLLRNGYVHLATLDGTPVRVA